MTRTPATTLLKPKLAPLGRTPEAVGAPRYITLERPEGPRYYTEAWKLTDGSVVVVVAHNSGRSMDHHQGEIQDQVHSAWKLPATVLETTIILDWGDALFMGSRFRILVRDGLSGTFDKASWRSRGVVFDEA